MSDDLHIENRIALEDNALELGVAKLGNPSLYTCPECHGVLLQLHGAGPLRFRCHTGHAFTAEALVAHAAETLEDELWNVVRAMDENQLLLRQVARQLETAGTAAAAARLGEQADAVAHQTQAIRQVALAHGAADPAGPTNSWRADQR